MTSTEVWLSAAVEKISDFLVGMVVLRGMSVVITPPRVSMPSDSGVTSRSSMSLTSPESTPACTAAPSATTSSGLTPLCGSLPKNSLTTCCTFGMRVEPPTSTTSAISDGLLVGVGERLLGRLDGALDEVVDHLLELRARQSHLQVLGARGVGGEERQVDLGLQHLRQLDLGLLGRLAQALQDHLVLGDVDALVLAELGDQPVHDPLVDVVAAQVGVAVGGDDLDHVLADLQDRDVEGAAAEVVDRDDLVLLLVEAVGQRGRGRLVDDALDVEAGDAAGVLGRLALRVVEVGRHGDDRLGHLLAQVVLGRLLELAEHLGRDLRRGDLLAANLEIHLAMRRRARS